MNFSEMLKRKKYLYSNVPIPRSTQYHRRKREKEMALAASVSAAAAQYDSESVNMVHTENCDVLYLDHGDSAHKEESCADRGSSSSVPQERSTFENDNGADYSDERVIYNESVESMDENFVENPEASDCGSDYAGEAGHQTISSDDDSTRGTDSEEEAGQSSALGHVCRDGEGDCDASCVDKASLLPDLATPLNSMTSTTEGDAILMCLAMGFCHSFTWTAIVDILAFVNKLFGQEVVKASKYHFLKHLQSPHENITYHIYCPNCERYLGTKTYIKEKMLEACQCGTVMKDINEASTYFLSLNFKDQIKSLLKDKQFVRSLSYRFQREKLNDDALEDLYDGEIYRDLSAPGEVLNDPYNMSYTFNTDGCPIGKSSKQTCWPIYIQINELPPRLRSKYMILAGLYVGRKDPNMKIFLYPFVEEANDMTTKGIDWVHNGKQINSKVIPLSACVDSVARCKILNMTQFNGWFGCTLCHYQAERCPKIGLRYTLPLNGLDERTHDSILVDSVRAYNNIKSIRSKNKRSVRGCKGPSPIHNMLGLDLVRGVRPDPMHSMLLGNAKHHTIIFEESFGQRYYIGSDVRLSAISSRLLSIKPPSSVMRTPRSLKEMKLWKATEWRSWILFYSVVCLYGVIPDEFVIHLSMLSSALHIILQKSISRDNLEAAHVLLLRYVFLYQQYFGKHAMVYNIHLLLHVKRSIECLGPAWTHSAFGFEGANKFLLQLKKGTSHISSEIASKYLAFKSLPTLCEKIASSEHAVEYCERLSGRSLKSYYRNGKAVLVGRGSSEYFCSEEQDVLKSLGINVISKALCFDKCINDGICYTTANRKVTKTDDSYIFFHGGIRGRIHKICELLWQNKLTVFLFVRVLRIEEKPLFDDEFGKMCPIKKVVGKEKLMVLQMSDIEGQCVAMLLDNGKFICDLPYGCYGDS